MNVLFGGGGKGREEVSYSIHSMGHSVTMTKGRRSRVKSKYEVTFKASTPHRHTITSGHILLVKANHRSSPPTESIAKTYGKECECVIPLKEEVTRGIQSITNYIIFNVR